MDEVSEWRSIRPWRPTLALSVREITSVSVTFTLSSPYTGSNPLEPLGNAHYQSDSDDDLERPQVVADVLSKGLSVKVNGIPWQRVLIRVDEESDEAVIILFGLMPGRQYDVELGVAVGHRTIRGQITTEVEAHTEPPLPEPHPDEGALSTSVPSSISSQALSSSPITSSISNASTSPPTSSHIPQPITLEDRRVQLAHMLTSFTNEHAQLSAELKTARRDSQKADASLRTEIETLRRAAEKGAANEQRARQKLLALREARKQHEAAAKMAEEERQEVEMAIPELERRLQEVEEELERVRERAEEARRQREEVERAERRRKEGWAAEMSALTKALERLAARKEKLEGTGGDELENGVVGTIGELEEKLRRLEEEREQVERDPYGYEGDLSGANDLAVELVDDTDDASFETEVRSPARSEHQGGTSSSGQSTHQQHSHHSHHNHSHHAHHLHPHRKRHSHPHTHNTHTFPLKTSASGRQDPTQRNSHSARLSLPNHRELNAGPGVIHLQPNVKAVAASTTSANTSGQSRIPVRSHSNSASGSASGSGTGSGGSSVASSPVPPSIPASSASGSGLSSRALPFEPAGLAVRMGGGTSTSASLVASRSELNPGSAPFSPRSAQAQAQSPVVEGARSRGGTT